MSDPLGIIYEIRIAPPAGCHVRGGFGGYAWRALHPGGAMAETGSRRGPADSSGHTELPARLGSGALSLADPMGPPPSVIRGRGNGPKGTPGPLGLSRGPPDSLLAGLIGRTYFRRENTPEILDSTLCRRVCRPGRSFCGRQVFPWGLSLRLAVTFSGGAHV